MIKEFSLDKLCQASEVGLAAECCPPLPGDKQVGGGMSEATLEHSLERFTNSDGVRAFLTVTVCISYCHPLTWLLPVSWVHAGPLCGQHLSPRAQGISSHSS